MCPALALRFGWAGAAALPAGLLPDRRRPPFPAPERALRCWRSEISIQLPVQPMNDFGFSAPRLQKRFPRRALCVLASSAARAGVPVSDRGPSCLPSRPEQPLGSRDTSAGAVLASAGWLWGSLQLLHLLPRPTENKQSPACRKVCVVSEGLWFLPCQAERQKLSRQRELKPRADSCDKPHEQRVPGPGTTYLPGLSQENVKFKDNISGNKVFCIQGLLSVSVGLQ